MGYSQKMVPIPLEAKLMCIWGRVYLGVFIGILDGDKIRVFRNGAVTPADSFHRMKWVVSKHWAKMVEITENICQMGFDIFRVDFFLSKEDGKMVINENELSNGHIYEKTFEEPAFLAAWRQGYLQKEYDVVDQRDRDFVDIYKEVIKHKSLPHKL